MEQYPDSITITVQASATQNASGYWASGLASSITFDCRAESNSAGRQIPGADGGLIDYAFQVFMPRTTVIIPSGSDCTLTTLLNGVFQGQVKRASNGQLNSRLWL